MNKESQEIIKKQLSILPPKVYSVLTNMDFPSHIKAISDKYKLRVDQSAVLEDEIMLVMLGIEHPDTFVINLSNQGGLSKEEAAAITIDINNSIFKLVRQELVDLHQKARLEREFDQPTQENRPAAQTTVAAPAQPMTAPTQQNQPAQPATETVRTLPKDIAQTKLEQSFRLPPSATTVKETPDGGAVKKPVDPYREPIA